MMAIGATEPAHLREEIELLRDQIKSDRLLLPGKTAKLLFIQQPCTHYPGKIWTQGIPDFTHLERDGIAPSWSEPPGNYRSTLRCRTKDGEDLACYAIYLDGYERAKEKFEQHAAAAGELLVPDAMVPGSEFIKELFEFCRLQKRLAWAFNEQPGHPETRRQLAWLHDLYDAFVSFLTGKLDGPPKSQTVIRDQATDVAISTSSLKAEASHHLSDSVAAVPVLMTTANDEAAGSFEDQGEFVRICGLGEDVTLEKTEGVERLVAIVTAPNRRVGVMELAKIGVAQQATNRDSVDFDADGLTERGSVNEERFESALGDDASRSVRDAVGDLMAKRDAAAEAGDEVEAKRLTEHINASLSRLKPTIQAAARNIKKTLDRTYQRLRDGDKGVKLAKHFDRFVKRRRNEPDYIYDPDESNRKIVWNLK